MRPRKYKYKTSAFNRWFAGIVDDLARKGITKKEIADAIGVGVDVVRLYCYRMQPAKNTMWIPICDGLESLGVGRFADLYREIEMMDRGVYT